MSKVLFKNPYILTMCDGEKVFKKDLLVIDNKIAKIGENIKDVDKDTKIIDASNTLLMPGFVNAHTHSAMVFSRSSSDNLSLSDWLNNCIFKMEANLTPDYVYNLDKVALLEYLTSGITTFFDMYYFSNSTYQLCRKWGFRSNILLCPSAASVNDDEFFKDADELFNKSDDLNSFRFGLHAEYTTNVDDINFVKKLIDKYHLPFSSHVCETKNETEGCKKRHNNLSPIEYFNSFDMFKYGGTLFHCVYLNDNDFKILKEKNISVVTCPGSNGKLASGIAPIKRLVAEGINVAIGTDGAGSNNCLDMFKEMHLLYSFSKIKEEDPCSLKAYDILKMATINGAKALGLKNLDGIKVGNYADIILIDLLKPNMQPINNLISNLVYSGSKDNIKLTMINGKILYYENKFLINENISDIYQKAQQISDILNKDNIYKTN